jgi:hypothetical protein
VATMSPRRDLMRVGPLPVVKPWCDGEGGGFWRTHPTGWIFDEGLQPEFTVAVACPGQDLMRGWVLPVVEP